MQPERLPGRDRHGATSKRDRGGEDGRRSTCRTSSRRRSARPPARANGGIFQTFLKNPSNVTGIAASSSSRLPRRRTRRASSALSAGEITAEPPVAAAPPPTAEPGRLGRYLTGGLFLAPALCPARRLDRLPDRLHDHPQLLRARPASSALGRDRQLQDAVHDLDPDDGDQEQRDLGRRRAGVRDARSAWSSPC